MRTFAEHMAETLALDNIQTLRLQAFLSAMKQDGEDTSAVVWEDVVAAGWHTMTELDALKIITKALR